MLISKGCQEIGYVVPQAVVALCSHLIDMHSNIGLSERYRKLMRDRRIAEARDLLSPLVDQDSIFGLTALADVEFEAGAKEQSEKLMVQAEQKVRDDDLDGHLDLMAAYRLGLGGGDRNNQDRLALKHMRHVANAGNPVVQLELANHYRYGLNGCPEMAGEAFKWMKLAAEILPEAKQQLKELGA